MMQIGEKKSMLTLMEYTGCTKGKRYGLFKCDCGNTKIICVNSVMTKSTKSCGCLSSSANKKKREQLRRMSIGTTINELTLIQYTRIRNTHMYGLFKCSCGNTKEILISRVTSEHTKSCGCLKSRGLHASGLRSRGIYDLTGNVYGRLTVLGESGKNGHTGGYWNCRCSCGNLVVVARDNLRTGNTKSCGCLSKNLSMERMIGLQLNGRVGMRRGKRSKFISSKQNIIICCDSSYERKAVEMWEFDSSIRKYERCTDRITYVNPVDGSSHVYLPDFIVDDTRMIEIKPQYQLDDPVVQAKAAAAEAYCSERGMTYEIWTEHELCLIK